MTVEDLITVLQQCPEPKAPVQIRVRDQHDWVLRSEIAEATFDERDQVVVLDGEA